MRAYDPVALQVAQHTFASDLKEVPEHMSRLQLTHERDHTLQEADALVIVTDWKEFKQPDFGHMKSQLKRAFIFDGRNLLDQDTMTRLGFEYHSIGRRATHPEQPVTARAIHYA